MSVLNKGKTINLTITNSLDLVKVMMLEPWGVHFEIKGNDKVTFIAESLSSDAEITISYLPYEDEIAMVVDLNCATFTVMINDVEMF